MSGLSLRQRYRTAIVAAAAICLIWPALVNGGPFFTVDSIDYIRGSDPAMIRVFGPSARTPWSAPAAQGRPSTITVKDEAAVRSPRSEASFVYGLLANLGVRSGGFWLTIAVQALAAAFALDLACRALGQRSLRIYLSVIAAAAFATPLAFTVDCIAPDVWIAIAVLAAAAVAAGGEQLTRLDFLLVFLMVSFAAVAQTPALAALLAIIVSAAGLLMVRRRMPFTFGAPAALLGLASAALIVALYTVAAFNPLPRAGNETEAPSAISASRPSLPSDLSWRGFQVFVLSGVDQLGSFSMEEFNEAPAVRQAIGRWMAQPERATWQASRAYRQGWPVRLMDLVLILLALTSLSGLCLLVFTSGRGRMLSENELTRRLMVAAWVVVAGSLANALACGGFMGVLGRQQVCVMAPLILVGLGAWITLIVRQTELMVQLYATTNVTEPNAPARRQT